MAFKFRMLLLERCDKLRHDKELISTDKNDELRIKGFSWISGTLSTSATWKT